MWIKSFISELHKIASGNEIVSPNDMRDGAPAMPDPNLSTNTESQFGQRKNLRKGSTKPTGWKEDQEAPVDNKPEPMKV
jgi:hypothetical protein